jgi:response regulator RpfG family c-di-GMP phosphodiesterase
MKRLLIVDDIPQNLYLLEVLLKTHGYEIESAVNGKEALEKARENLPDMLITDILMPGMDGFSLCRIWKTDPELKKIPLIFYTATYTDEKDKEFALGLGADRFVVKPMEPDDLLQIVEEVFQEKEKNDVVIPDEPEEEKYIREYNQVLIRKLEDKMMQLQDSNKRLFTLYHTSNILGEIKPVNESIHEVLKALVDKAGYQHAFYFSYDETKGGLYLQDAVSQVFSKEKTPESVRTYKLGEEEGLVGLAAQTGEIINISNTENDFRWVDYGDNVKSALFIPVRYESHLLGVLSLYSLNVGAFSEVDEHILTTLANNLAAAIENRSSQELIQNQFQRLSSLHKIDMAIINSTDLMVTLNLLISHVISQLQVDASAILLYNLKSQSFKYVVESGFLKNLSKSSRQDHLLAMRAMQERKMVHIGISDQLPPSYPFQKNWDFEGFRQYWGIPIIAKGNVKGVLEVYNRSKINPNQEWIDYLETLAGQAAIAIENAEIQEGLLRSNYELNMAYDATIEGWSRAMDLRDRETEGHALRVTDLTIQLARMAGIDEDEILHIRRGSLLHDMGKLGIPDSILHKPGPLNEEEWELMRKHPVFAYEMIAPINYLKKAIDIPYCHHERWDGSGYPRGLKGEEIPLVARIFAVADVYDALTSDRPYRSAWSKEKALEYISSLRSIQFDPQVVDSFFELIESDPGWLEHPDSGD